MLHVREGDRVRRGQVLAVIDLAGAAPAQLSAKEKAEEALEGFRLSARREEVRRCRDRQEEALRRHQRAKAQLDLLRAGSRREEVERMRAYVRQMEANLSMVRDGPRQEVVARYRASYLQAKNQLELLRKGPREEQKEQARLAYEQVKARHDLLIAGATPQDIEQQRAAVRQARVTLGSADSELKRSEQLFSRGLIASQHVEQAKTRRDVAKAQLQSAEQRMRGIELGAREQERSDSQAQLKAADQRLKEVLSGPRPEEIRTQELQVEIYRQHLAEAEAGPRPEEVRTAEAQLEVYRQQLAAAEAGARPEELQSAEAVVAEAAAEVRTAKAALDLAVASERGEAAAAALLRQTPGPPEQMAQPSPGRIEIVAPLDGVVRLCVAKAGDAVNPGSVIIRMGGDDDAPAVATASEGTKRASSADGQQTAAW